MTCSKCGEQIEVGLWWRSHKLVPLDVGRFTLGNLDELGRVHDTAVVRLVPRAELDERRERDDAFRRAHRCPL